MRFWGRIALALAGLLLGVASLALAEFVLRLAGSDPLPLAGEDTRAGSCAFELLLRAADGGPAELLRHAVSDLTESPRRFEQRCGAARFVATQLAMQVLKRRRQ